MIKEEEKNEDKNQNKSEEKASETDTPAGEMMVFNMINLAQFERKQTAERVSLNFNSRALRGLWNGGPQRLGYMTNPEDKSKLLVNEAEAEDVRKIFNLFLDNGTVGKTLKVLKGETLKPKEHTNRIYCRSNAGQWTRSTLYNLLRNPAYMGSREINRKNKDKDPDTLQPYQRYQVVKASWPAIVDEFTFLRVQKALDAIQKLERERLDKTHERPYIATGILTCKDCGRPLMGAAATGRNEVHRYYAHRSIEGEKITCRVKRHHADEIEETIVRHLLETLKDEAHLASVIKKVRSTDEIEVAQMKKKYAAKESEVQNIDRDIDFLIRQTRETADLDMARTFREKVQTFLQLKTEKTSELHMLREKTLEAEDAADSAEEIRVTLEEIHNGFTKAASSVKKRLLRRMLARVVVTPKTLELFYRSDKASPVTSSAPKAKMASESSSGAIVLPLTSPFSAAPNASRDLEVVGSSISLNGRGQSGKGHFSSPCSYVLDTIIISELPKYQDFSFLHQKYIVENLPAKKIALQLGCSTTSIKEYLRANGLSKGGPGSALHREKLAYGKKISGHTTQDHKGEIKIIESIKQMYRNSGLGPVAIARILNTMKIPTKRQGKKWDHSVVKAILEREGIYQQTRKSPQRKV